MDELRTRIAEILDDWESGLLDSRDDVIDGIIQAVEEERHGLVTIKPLELPDANA